MYSPFTLNDLPNGTYNIKYPKLLTDIDIMSTTIQTYYQGNIHTEDLQEKWYEIIHALIDHTIHKYAIVAKMNMTLRRSINKWLQVIYLAGVEYESPFNFTNEFANRKGIKHIHCQCCKRESDITYHTADIYAYVIYRDNMPENYPTKYITICKRCNKITVADEIEGYLTD